MKIKCENAKERNRWIDYVCFLISNEWGNGDTEILNSKKQKMINDDDIKPYILLIDEQPIGCFVITKNDIKNNPNYNPNLACVCIENKYRGKGYSKYILNASIEEFKKLNIKKAYLKTSLVGFYEKVGWIPINEYYENEMIYEINL